jgi:hypothetical protein
MPPKTLSCILTIFALFAAIMPSGCTKSDTSTPSTASQPLITGVTPTEVKAGAMIVITGSGFGDNKDTSVLTLGGAAAASILSWSDSEIKAIVPEGALTGAVKAKVQDKDSDEKHLVVLWDNENPQNVGIVGSHWSPLLSQLIADGSGGAIVAWNDYRNYDPGSTAPHQINIYAQRLNSRGKIAWSSGEVPLSTVAGGQYFPQLVTDGSGGAIVVWEDYRGGADIYAQRISGTGALVWASDVAVCAAASAQEEPKIVPDGSGGAIIVWQDYRSGSQYEVYAQRINGNGVPQWTANGVAVSTASNNPQFLFPEIIADGSGGAIIVWQDYRSSAWYLYAQRVDSAGAVQWAADGVRLSTTAAIYQYVPRPVADGFGGAIVAWESSSGENGTNIYTQRIDASGVLQWGSAGTVVSAAIDDQTLPQMTTDGNGGAIITWEDCRVGSAFRDIYAQRVNAAGTVQWTADGVPVSTAAYSQYEPQITPDGKGGAIITWYDYRNYDILNHEVLEGVDTFAQRISSDGTALWTTDGEAISTADLHQMYPKLVSDDSGGAIILWEDERSGTTVDLYAQGISTCGKQ